MHDHFSLAEAKAKLSALIDRVERGEEIEIHRRGRPVARIVPARPSYEAVALRARALRNRTKGSVLVKGETWRSLAHEGHRK
ncbi:MAG: type II toxin-antitoxin system Phd/YefM family antitoxin [Candidatus Tyrphobacter sp.]